LNHPMATGGVVWSLHKFLFLFLFFLPFFKFIFLNDTNMAYVTCSSH
jgi:hypothetical protein